MANVSLSFVDAGEAYLWTNFGFIAAFCLSYESERLVVVHFLSLEELRRTQKALNDSQALVLQTKKDHVRFISHGASHISFGFICYEYIVSL